MKHLPQLEAPAGLYSQFCGTEQNTVLELVTVLKAHHGNGLRKLLHFPGVVFNTVDRYL
jgi:hypothetical protein